MTDLSRISTGSEALDRILGGGFPGHSVNVIMGDPGTGKTVLAEQMLFRNAGGDRPVLYLTTLSEPLGKVLTYLQGFSFFDASLMGEGVIYEDMTAELLENGIAGMVGRIKRAIRELGPRMIVIDSFKALHDLGETTSEFRRQLADLAGVLAAYETTAFLVGEYADDQIPHCPEFAVADGVIHMQRVSTGKADVRYLRVLKLRGSVYQEGLHAFGITADGLEVHPRLVTPTVPRTYTPSVERVTTGIEGLDDILAGGLWKGSTALVVGPEGSGKTTLGLAFCLGGVEAGEPSVLLNFQEDPAQMTRTLERMTEGRGFDPDRGLHLRYFSPVELQIDSLVAELFRLIEGEGVRRVVIDAAGDLALASGDRSRFHDYVYSLVKHFAARRVTALLTFASPTIALDGGPRRFRFASMSDTIIELAIDLEGPARRTLRVMKARGIDHDLNAHHMEIHSRGIRLANGVDHVRSLERDGG